MLDDITDQFPLATEPIEAILARLQADENAGIDPADPLYADTVPGSVWDDLARADALEMDRVYDRMFNEVPAAAIPSGATGTWLDEWAAAVLPPDQQRKAATAAAGVIRFLGADGTEVGAGTQVSTESPAAGVDPATYQTVTLGTIGAVTAGILDAEIVAVELGSQGNVPANAITVLETPIDGVSITNIAAITGGSDVETDEALQGRIVKKLRGTNGAGNVDYYENIALAYPGVGFVTVQPNTPSVGHVTVMISDVNRDPAPSTIIDGLQALLDPSPDAGQGAGLAAPGATVIVSTPGTTAVAVAATIVPDDGYSIDGSGGTTDVSDDIAGALERYFLTLGAGADVIHNKVLAAIIDVAGVADVSALTLNGGGGSVAIGATNVAELTLPPTLT